MLTLLYAALKKPVLYVPLALVVFGMGWFVLGGEKEDAAILVIKREPFIQEVSVSGKVIAEKSVDLVFSQSGRIAAVYTKVGDSVSRGAVLAELENADARAEIVQKEAALAAAEAKLHSLEEGIRAVERAVTEQDYTNAGVGEAQARIALSDAVKSAYFSADDAVRNRVDQFIREPEGSDPELLFLIPDPQLEADIERGRFLMGYLLSEWSSVIASLRAGEESAAAEASAENLGRVREFLEKVSRAVNALAPSPALPEGTIAGYRAGISAARANIANTASALTSALTSEKNAAAARATAEKQLALADAPAREEDKATQEAAVRIAAADLARAKELYRKTVVTAPFSGIITRVEAKAGGTASPAGAPLSMISDGTLQIESFIPEINVPLVLPGDKAEATLDAYGIGTPFVATVVAIDPAETIRDGVATYRAILSFSEKDPRVKPGMTATITIVTDEKPSVVAVPQGAVVLRGGISYVRVKDVEGEEELRAVMTGSVSSLGTVEILSGLREGETIFLRGEDE